MADYLLEIGIEEVPAGFLPGARAGLREGVQAALAAHAGVIGDKTEVRVLATPRRLALFVRGLPECSLAATVRHKGPPVSVAFDKEGAPTKAALGFAKKLGLDPAALVQEENYVVGVEEKPGRSVKAILAESLPGVLSGLSWPKSMRWNATQQRCVRPVRWLVSLWENEVLAFEWAGLTAGRETLLRRLVSRAGAFDVSRRLAVAGVATYLQQLRDEHVLVDETERARVIGQGIEKIAADLGARPVYMDGDTTLAYLADHVEGPIALLGQFAAKFTVAPREVLELTMWRHQKYVPLEKDGQLLPNFVITADRSFGPGAGDADFTANVLAGNSRVISARLADARYFWEEDSARFLESRVEDLKRVTFQKDAGSMYDRVTRIEKLALAIAADFGVANTKDVARAARLAKADLTTHMVFEFPELQGVIGRRLTEAHGEKPEIACAIAEHYWPTGADSPVPRGLSAVVALAEKADTIASIFGVGLEPTGSADPYGLRRAAIGIVRIVLEADVDFDIRRLATDAKVLEFIRARLIHYVVEKSAAGAFDPAGEKATAISAQIAEAVAAAGWHDFRDFLRRALAARRLLERADYEDLKTSFKRVMNILSDGKSTEGEDRPVEEALLAEPAEKRLHAVSERLARDVAQALAERRVDDALAAMTAIRPDVDGFFDAIMVNAEEPALRRNRRALLRGIGRTFLRVMDFSRL